MAYQANTIATIISRLNVNYFLPAIQREFVWRPEQIVQLFDSIMRRYPISSFLFWELQPENRGKWDVYSFITNYNPQDTRAEQTSTNGVQQLTLVLDGQQRLTSLQIGLRGTYTIKKKYMWWGNPEAWVDQKLYLDLLKDPKSSEDDGEAGIHYGFQFLPAAKKPEHTEGHYWFEVGRILNFDNEDRFDEFMQQEEDNLPSQTTREQVHVFQRNLSRLYRAVWKDDVIAYYTEHDQEYDRVLDIFVRANEGGTKLSKSDLLLSMVTANWGDVNAREEIYGFVDRINNDLSRKNNFDKDLIMKACLVLSNLPVEYKVNNFNSSNLDLIRRNWPGIKLAIETTVNLVNSFGIDRDTLTSANALIPIAYYLYSHPGMTLLGTSQFDVKNASTIRQWLAMVLLNNILGGQSDSTLRDMRRVLQDRNSERDFPVEALNAEVQRSGRTARFNEEAIEDFLEITYGRQVTFLALSLLYDEYNWGAKSFHVDHIFPRALFTPKKMQDAGFDADQAKRYPDLVNHIANLELLLPYENISKSDTDFGTWLATRDESFRARHLIPDDPALLSVDRFEEFIQVREDMIRQRLRNVFPLADRGALVAAAEDRGV